MACLRSALITAASFFLALLSLSLGAPPTQIFPSPSHATASVIFLHGFNTTVAGTKNSLGAAFKRFQSAGFAHVRFIIPFGALDVPGQPITGPPITGPPPPTPDQGKSWFTFGFDTTEPTCQRSPGVPCEPFTETPWGSGFYTTCPSCVIGGEADIDTAAARVNALIASEVASGIPAGRVVLVGYSQGGALASKVFAEGTVAFGGALAFVAWLPGGRGFSVPAARKTSWGIRYVLAEKDFIIPAFTSEVSVEVLREAGVEVETTVVAGAGHVLGQAVVVDEVTRFMQRRIPAEEGCHNPGL